MQESEVVLTGGGRDERVDGDQVPEELLGDKIAEGDRVILLDSR